MVVNIRGELQTLKSQPWRSFQRSTVWHRVAVGLYWQSGLLARGALAASAGAVLRLPPPSLAAAAPAAHAARPGCSASRPRRRQELGFACSGRLSSASLDHLIGAGEKRGRDGEAERLGGREIDDELEPRWLLDRHLGGRGALEDAIHITRAALKKASEARTEASAPRTSGSTLISDARRREVGLSPRLSWRRPRPISAARWPTRRRCALRVSAPRTSMPTGRRPSTPSPTPMPFTKR